MERLITVVLPKPVVSNAICGIEPVFTHTWTVVLVWLPIGLLFVTVLLRRKPSGL